MNGLFFLFDIILFFESIVSYRIVSYRIVSYRIVSYRIVSYRIVSYLSFSFDDETDGDGDDNRYFIMMICLYLFNNR
jgi:hypothetical protein